MFSTETICTLSQATRCNLKVDHALPVVLCTASVIMIQIVILIAITQNYYHFTIKMLAKSVQNIELNEAYQPTWINFENNTFHSLLERLKSYLQCNLNQFRLSFLLFLVSTISFNAHTLKQFSRHASCGHLKPFLKSNIFVCASKLARRFPSMVPVALMTLFSLLVASSANGLVYVIDWNVTSIHTHCWGLTLTLKLFSTVFVFSVTSVVV